MEVEVIIACIKTILEKYAYNSEKLLAALLGFIEAAQDQKTILERLEKLEKDSHPQDIAVDPAIKDILERLKDGVGPSVHPDPNPWRTLPYEVPRPTITWDNSGGLRGVTVC